MSKAKYGSVQAEVCKGNSAITVARAKELLGWTEVEAGEPYHIKHDGKLVWFESNQHNRPYRVGLAKRYCLELLRGKWHLNGETIIIDRMGQLHSGQHRLMGLILAEQTRLQSKEQAKDPKYTDWVAENGIKGPIKLETVIVTGVSDQQEVADTIDLGQKRSLGDVVFRNSSFEEYEDKEAKRLSNILAGATRLAWIRAGGKVVSSAPHFPHSEALEFIEEHPALMESVKFVYEEEGGGGVEGKNISDKLSLAYAAGLHYLQSTCASNGSGEVDLSMKNKADEFWTLSANGTGLTKDSPVYHMNRLLGRIDASGGEGRDEKIGTVVKAWNLWVDEKPAAAKDVKMKKTRDPETEKMVFAEEPRMGGLDVVIEIEEEEYEEEPGDDELVLDDDLKPSKSKGGWAKGDVAWVQSDEDDKPWLGVVENITDDGKHAVLVDSNDGEEYEEALGNLRVRKPK